MLRSGWGVTAVVVLFGTGAPLAQESVRFAIGGGLAVTDADLEGAAEAQLRSDEHVLLHQEGAYGVFQTRLSNNLLFQVAISDTRVAGGGFEIGGSDHHSFYLALSFDFGYEVEFPSGPGSSEFDLRELHLGYLYRF